MSMVNRITINDINNIKINPQNLTQILHDLVILELYMNEIAGNSFIPLNINASDGGEDGLVKWKKGPNNTKMFPKKYCLFQSKATNLIPSKCYEEIIVRTKSKKIKLKKQIADCVKAKGCYILFTSAAHTNKAKNSRINEFRRAIKDSGYKNHKEFSIKIYDANIIHDWVNKYISIVTLVQKFNGISRPIGFRVWDDWYKNLYGSNVEYQSDKTIIENFKLINQGLLNDCSARILGHSGIGKTRLALEFFRYKTTEYESKSYQKQATYFEIGTNGSAQDINNYIISNPNQYGIIVVDNCNEENHLVIRNLAKSNSKFKIITISHHDETFKGSIVINRRNQQDIVKKIIDSKLSETHNQTDRDYLSRLSEGYPWMAVRFCDEIDKADLVNFTCMLPEIVVKKLLFGTKRENEIEYEVIRACSVVSAFNYIDEDVQDLIPKEQRKILNKEVDFIRKEIYSEEITKDKFKSIILEYRKRGIIERRGLKYYVKPTILAINLAASWLENSDDDRIENILNKIDKNELSKKFVERLRDLDQLDKAQILADEYWGVEGPFGKAEVLNTEWGSLLFRYIVEVNPKATVNTLERNYLNQSKEELLKVGHGRRNLVWALEKLCFRKETFSKAAKVLLAFAVSENEKWSNNSTGQFVQLFQVRLPGTAADLGERFKLLEYGLHKKDSDYDKVIIQAMDNALRYGHFSRSGLANRQGSSVPIKEYIPKTYGEIFTYWKNIINVLIKLACSENVNSEKAKDTLTNSFRTLVSLGKFDIVDNTIKKVINYDKKIWLGGIKALKNTLLYEKRLREIDKGKINALIQELNPRNIEEKILMTVSKPEWYSTEKDENNHYINTPGHKAKEFAEEILRDNIDIAEYYPLLLKGEQRQGITFGLTLGKLTEDKEEIIEILIEQMKSIEENELNPDFFAGVLSSVEDQCLLDKTIDKLLCDKKFNEKIFQIVRIVQPPLNTIDKLFSLIDNGLSISYFANFQYGGSLMHLTLDEMITLTRKVFVYKPLGCWVRLSLFYMYASPKNISWAEIKDYVKEILTSQNMLAVSKNNGIMESYYWSEYVIKFLEEENDNDFASVIVKQIIDSSEISGLKSTDRDVEKVSKVLLEKYFDITWSKFALFVLENDFHISFNLIHILGTDNGNFHVDVDLFENEQVTQNVINWFVKNKIKDPIKLIRLFPSFTNTNAEWHPITKFIIDQYGSDDVVLNEIGSKLGSFGYSGSMETYYNDQIVLMELLHDHPIEAVREWAQKHIEYAKKNIKRTIIDEEENGLR